MHVKSAKIDTSWVRTYHLEEEARNFIINKSSLNLSEMTATECLRYWLVDLERMQMPQIFMSSIEQKR